MIFQLPEDIQEKIFILVTKSKYDCVVKEVKDSIRYIIQDQDWACRTIDRHDAEKVWNFYQYNHTCLYIPTIQNSIEHASCLASFGFNNGEYYTQYMSDNNSSGESVEYYVICCDYVRKHVQNCIEAHEMNHNL